VRSAYNISVGKSEGNNYLGDLEIDGRITPKFTLTLQVLNFEGLNIYKNC
jgi:hypothetical protein